MSRKTGIKINNVGFRELRRSPRVVAELSKRADRVAATAGPGFESRQAPGRNRARFIVIPTSPQAYRANARDLAVLRALNAGAQ